MATVKVILKVVADLGCYWVKENVEDNMLSAPVDIENPVVHVWGADDGGDNADVHEKARESVAGAEQLCGVQWMAAKVERALYDVLLHTRSHLSAIRWGAWLIEELLHGK